MAAMALSTKLIKRFEATTVYSHPKATADIVLVHGLNGSPDHTWTASNGVFWPIQLLVPTLVDAPANIIVYGYNADVATWKKDSSPTDNFVYQHAQDLVMSLATHRRNAGTMRNPIIWVCHSLGGIITKRALLYANDVRDPELEICRSIYVSTYAMIFLGTPHTGSNLAPWGQVLQGMSGVIPRRLFDSEPVLLKTLKKDNAVLQEINIHFLDIYRRFKIHMVRENKKTDLKWTVDFVVDANSAGPQLPGVTYYSIEATHSAMCKFESADAPGYSNVSSTIHEWVSEAPDSIQTRWRVEEEERTARARNEVDEIVKNAGGPATKHTPIMGTPPSYASDVFPIETNGHPALPKSPRSMSSMPSLEGSRPKAAQSLVIHPYKIRPNAHFKGRQKELEELHVNLKDTSRRQIGTSAVLLQSLPGGGKTHLARQYVFNHGHEYRGGIYWIPSRSEQEMEEAFWMIARARTMQEFEAEPWKRDLLDPKKMVETVRNWFESFDDWLIVFDGIRFDAPKEAYFIPNTKNTSILYTSTNRAAHGDHKFDNPVLLELGQLSQRDAQELLLEEMGKTADSSVHELAQAGQAVKMMDRLPLMIHVAGQHLKATREPLVKYIHSFKGRGNLGRLDAYKSVREELERRGEIEALNLMYILCFFAQKIPVEMVVLGLRALDNRTPVKAKDATNRRSLNNTLTVLIRYALIGRNESDDSSSTSSSSSRRSDPSLTEPSDTLRVHSIIQRFFVDTLIECKEAPFWLESAVKVFCHSYDIADLRIRQDPKIGLPEDYRLYSIHGKQLLDRLEQLARKRPYLHPLRTHLNQRLESINAGIDELTKTLTRTLIQGYSDWVRKSIFEGANSFSDSDSTNTSQNEDMSFYHHFAESPVAYGSLDVYGVIETPYPPVDEFPMLNYPDDINMDGGTKTPQPPSSPTSVRGVPTDPSFHRTVKKLEEKRYHDRAGSMRQTVGDHADARINLDRKPATGEILSPSVRSDSPSEQSPDSAARTHLLKISNSLSWRRKSTQSSGKSSPVWSLLEKTFGKSPLASEASSMPTQEDVTTSPPSVSVACEDYAKRETGTLATRASHVTRDSSHDSLRLQERLSRSDVVPGIAPKPMWDEEPRRGVSVPPSRQYGSYIDDEDLLAFPPDHPPTNPSSVDMPSWPANLQPTGYTSQPMSRQTSDNPTAQMQRGTPRSVPSGYATPRPRQRRPSLVETEPSPRLALLESGAFQNWEENHVRGGQFGSVPGSKRGRGRTIGEYVGRTPGLGFGESPLSGGIITHSGIVAFGSDGGGVNDGGVSRGDGRKGEREESEEDLRGVGLGIMSGMDGA